MFHAEYILGGGKIIDLVAEKARHRIAIEIETGKSNVESIFRSALPMVLRICVWFI